MNKKGHIAIAVASGSAALSVLPIHGLLQSVLMVTFAMVGGLAPDIDHKTSTASNHIQLPHHKRIRLKRLSFLFMVIGVAMLACQNLWANPTPFLIGIFKSFPLWIGAGVISWTLTKLRTFILIGTGALLLLSYYQYELHWMILFCGIVLVILPALKHRGLIHSPEFAAALTVGLLSLKQGGAIQVIGIGFLIGWWSHLAADCFGKEGIHSLIIPKYSLHLNLFSNGGLAEKFISIICWVATTLIWTNLLNIY
ncbi:hypothetical protein ABE82_26135 (plasmid) [Paenibacillus peoriae]|uniref:metal-dependent hydrolase n=1 Tax=Paenibacillus peoriae TaxID=59893 RepID=UPI000722D316|nr:metal-dependent hydrolase [Paenibacillus peoriae]ALS09901.1 hypothetical protein ABE82_26135 [Paenibacillus peoriae]